MARVFESNLNSNRTSGVVIQSCEQGKMAREMPMYSSWFGYHLSGELLKSEEARGSAHCKKTT